MTPMALSRAGEAAIHLPPVLGVLSAKAVHTSLEENERPFHPSLVLECSDSPSERDGALRYWAPPIAMLERGRRAGNIGSVRADRN